MSFFETIFYAINLWIGGTCYGAIDMGGSMYIHAFGAYYGLAIAYVFSTPKSSIRTNNHSYYTSDTFSLIGTIFLWMFWPSFNAAMGIGGQQHRVVINTVLSLCASAAVTFSYSALLNDGKFEIVEIQNATLAGGVAIGCSSDLVIGPWGALLIGFVAGTISTFGFKYLTPYLEKKIGLHDTAGIHNLHGMPGILGALGGIFSSYVAGVTVYGTQIGFMFPKRATSNATLAEELGILPGIDRSAHDQAGYQAAAIVTSVSFGICSGLFTAYILKLPCFTKIDPDLYFLDTPNFHLPVDYPGNPKPKDSKTKFPKTPQSKENPSESSEDSTSFDTNTVNMSTLTVTIPDPVRHPHSSKIVSVV